MRLEDVTLPNGYAPKPHWSDSGAGSTLNQGDTGDAEKEALTAAIRNGGLYSGMIELNWLGPVARVEALTTISKIVRQLVACAGDIEEASRLPGGFRGYSIIREETHVETDDHSAKPLLTCTLFFKLTSEPDIDARWFDSLAVTLPPTAANISASVIRGYEERVQIVGRINELCWSACCIGAFDQNGHVAVWMP